VVAGVIVAVIVERVTLAAASFLEEGSPVRDPLHHKVLGLVL
jgi:hypothetical protein